jgi:hypothetical protein
VVNKATLLLYLFRADLLYREDVDHKRRIHDDAELIGGFLGARPRGSKQPRVALVGTHYDNVLGYSSPSEGTSFYRWHVKIEDHPVISAARLQMAKTTRDRPALVVGSMKTLHDTQELAFRLFSQEIRL